MDDQEALQVIPDEAVDVAWATVWDVPGRPVVWMMRRAEEVESRLSE